MAKIVPRTSSFLSKDQWPASDKIAELEKKISAAKSEMARLQEEMNPIIKAHRDASDLVYALEDELYAIVQGQLSLVEASRG